MSYTDRRRKVIKQVEKLMALSGSSNEAEASLAAEKASELVMKFMISEEEIRSPESKRAEKPVEIFIHYDHYETGFVYLLNAIARNYGVICIHDRTGGVNHGHSFAIGFKTELDLVDRLFQRLHRIMDAEAKKAWLAAPQRDAEAKKAWLAAPQRVAGSNRGRAAFIHGFHIGFAGRIAQRLEESVAKSFEDAGGSKDLVLVPRAERTKSYADELHPPHQLGKVKSKRTHHSGILKGAEAGNAVSLATGEVKGGR
jgi:hypothetical protein